MARPSDFCTIAIALALIGSTVAPASPLRAATEMPAEPQAPTLDFDLFGGTDSPVAAEAVDLDQDRGAVSGRRRRLLKIHQALGLTTLGLTALTTAIGQLNYSDEYSARGGRTGIYLAPHRALAYTTLAAFTTTGSFAIFAPKLSQKSDGIDTTFIHKCLVTGAGLGMAAQLGLGFVTARYADAGNPRDLRPLARSHLATGYTTAGLLLGAALTWIF